MRRTTRSHSRSLLAHTALILVAWSALLAPGPARADSPLATASTSVTTLAAYTAANARTPQSSLSNLRPRGPEPTRTSFVSADLLEAATGLVRSGVEVGKGLAGGTVYVHVRPRGLGGVLSVRYRR